MSVIANKKKNYELCHSGAYGNRVLQWASLAEWKASGYNKPVAMRVAGSAGGGPSSFHVPSNGVEMLARSWQKWKRVSLDDIRLSEMADGPRVLQGEYLNDVYIQDGEPHHCYFLGTFESGPMPLALEKSSFTTYGLRADLLLRHYMTPASYEDWQGLLLQYPGHVLEVSVWDSCLGDLTNRNAIVWEIRRY
jgi:hypothetical protein